MPSKEVIRRQRLAEALRTSLVMHKGALMEGLQRRLEPVLGEGEILQSYELIHQFFLDLLIARESAVVAADEAHLAEVMDDRDPRRRRNLAAAEVRRVLVGIRRAAAGFFGTEEAAEVLNLEGLTSRDPVTLHRQATRVMERLRDPALVLPPSQLSGEAPDREGWAARLEPALAALKETNDAVGEEDREAELTLAAKRAALADHDQDVSALLRIVQGFLQLGDRRDLAEEVRPARLRRRARAASPGGGGEEQPGGGDAPGSDEPTGTGEAPAPDPPGTAGNGPPASLPPGAEP